MSRKKATGVWTIEFDGHPPVPLKDDTIGTVGWTPPDTGRFPFEMSGPVILSHYEFKLDDCPPLRGRGGNVSATLSGPNFAAQPGTAQVDYFGWSDGRRKVETYDVVFRPKWGAAADV